MVCTHNRPSAAGEGAGGFSTAYGAVAAGVAALTGRGVSGEGVAPGRGGEAMCVGGVTWAWRRSAVGEGASQSLDLGAQPLRLAVKGPQRRQGVVEARGLFSEIVALAQPDHLVAPVGALGRSALQARRHAD